MELRLGRNPVAPVYHRVRGSRRCAPQSWLSPGLPQPSAREPEGQCRDGPRKRGIPGRRGPHHLRPARHRARPLPVRGHRRHAPGRRGGPQEAVPVVEPMRWDGADDAIALTSLPAGHWKKIWSGNPSSGQQGRSKVRTGADSRRLPQPRALLRLAGAVLGRDPRRRGGHRSPPHGREPHAGKPSATSGWRSQQGDGQVKPERALATALTPRQQSRTTKGAATEPPSRSPVRAGPQRPHRRRHHRGSERRCKRVRTRQPWRRTATAR